MATDPVSQIIRWQLDIGCRPDDDMAVKHLGFALEECAEGLKDVGLLTESDEVDDIAKWLKADGIAVVDDIDAAKRRALADMFCDLIVYSIGGLIRSGYDPLKSLAAVAASNDSKRLEDGSFMRNEHGKIIKPPHYVEPSLDGCEIVPGQPVHINTDSEAAQSFHWLIAHIVGNDFVNTPPTQDQTAIAALAAFEKTVRRRIQGELKALASGDTPEGAPL